MQGAGLACDLGSSRAMSVQNFWRMWWAGLLRWANLVGGLNPGSDGSRFSW